MAKNNVVDILDDPTATSTDILSEASDTIEKTLDIVESQVDRVVTVTKSNPWIVAGALLVGVGIGGFIAYKIAQKRTTEQYENEILPEQLAMARSFQKRLAKTEEFETVDSAAEALIPDEIVATVKTYRGDDGGERVAYNQVPLAKEVAEATPEAETPVEPVVTTAVDRNVFSPANDPRDWDYQAEVAVREENPHKPYVISHEEFAENSNDHDQNTLTYYDGDDTLADERAQAIHEVEQYIGEDNLHRFGHGSGDVHVVYVRNDDKEMDFEIIRDPGYFAVEVLGLDPPEKAIRHSHQRRGRRQRADE